MGNLLDIKLLTHDIALQHTVEQHWGTVSMSDNASMVMTDFKYTTALSIAPNINIGHANERMIGHSVRLLFVVNDVNKVVGLITATDLLGEKPVQFMNTYGGNRDNVTVRDVMTPYNKLEGVEYAEVKKSKVTDIVTTLNEMHRQHMLVLANNSAGDIIIRGLFSSTQVSKQLGMMFSPGEGVKNIS